LGARTAEREASVRSTTSRPVDNRNSKQGLFTVTEAAQILGLRPRTVREYVHRGELSGRLIRKRWRFRRNDLAEFLGRPPEWELR
jgi:excisionase family DNA binding protein